MQSWTRYGAQIVLVALTLIGLSPVGAVTSPAVAGPVECTTTAAVERCATSFAFTGDEQVFVVPAGISALTVEVVGASGGGTAFGLGGIGVVVDATIAVTPGQALYVRVGGAGASGGAPGTASVPGGFNGGGGGAVATYPGGGGGGASDVRTVPGSELASTLASRLVVAGAGGGASYNGYQGGSAGQSGGSPGPGAAAQPGTSSAGGPGAVGAYGSSAGEDGSAGLGGHSGNQQPCCISFGGGGGGAGLYGGGGGSGSNAGAGGSSLVPADGTVTLAPSRGDGSVTLSWVIPPPPTPSTPGSAPRFTSSAAVAFKRGQPGTYTITASGDPKPSLRLTAGTLPGGLTFADHGDGTATISGTPTGRARVGTLTLTASNPGGTTAQQLQVSITLTPGACANTVAGTPVADNLIGSSAGDRLLGFGGDDRLAGRSARDCLVGGSGADDLRGGRGSDTLHGRAEADDLSGGAGRDRIRGGQGDDVIHARDGQVDDISCGTGQDRVSADPEDHVSGCEAEA